MTWFVVFIICSLLHSKRDMRCQRRGLKVLNKIWFHGVLGSSRRRCLALLHNYDVCIFSLVFDIFNNKWFLLGLISV